MWPWQRTGAVRQANKGGLNVVNTGVISSLVIGIAQEPTVDAGLHGGSVAVPLGRLPREMRGRKPLLRGLRQQLRTGGLVVLAGTGGVGKSTVATELARQAFAAWRWRLRRRRQVWWVSASDRAILSAGLVSVARRLGATHSDLNAIESLAPDGPDRLWALLDRARRGWLLVFDNADDPQVLAAPAILDANGEPSAVPAVADGTGWARASRRGLVLVTSRQREPAAWARGIVHDVVMLSESEAAQVLRDLAPEAGDQAQAKALGRRLGGLPLALHLAGSYLGSEFAGRRSFAAYQQALDAGPGAAARLFKPDPDIGPFDERTTVMRTW